MNRQREFRQFTETRITRISEVTAHHSIDVHISTGIDGNQTNANMLSTDPVSDHNYRRSIIRWFADLTSFVKRPHAAVTILEMVNRPDQSDRIVLGSDAIVGAIA